MAKKNVVFPTSFLSSNLVTVNISCEFFANVNVNIFDKKTQFNFTRVDPSFFIKKILKKYCYYVKNVIIYLVLV